MTMGKGVRALNKGPKQRKLSKHSAAVYLGKSGGLIGGPQRDKALSKARKVNIAKMGGHAKAAAAKGKSNRRRVNWAGAAKK